MHDKFRVSVAIPVFINELMMSALFRCQFLSILVVFVIMLSICDCDVQHRCISDMLLLLG